MTWQTWFAFVGMTFIVSATPGPNMLLVMTVSAQHGLRRSIATMLGCMAALLLMLSLSAAGLGALLHSFPRVFDALRWAGALYLAYLGVQCWRSPVAVPPEDAASPTPSASPIPSAKDSQLSAQLFMRGVLVAASNPKAILFAAAFFPQFLNPALAQLPQFGILLSTFALIEVSWYFIYALGGKQLSSYLLRPAVRRAFNRATGGAFVGFAALMAATRA